MRCFSALPRLLVAGILVAQSTVVPIDAIGESSDPAADLEVALASLEYQAELTKGWIVEFTTDTKTRDRAGAPISQQIMRFVERRLGDKFSLEQEELSAKIPDNRWFERRAFDGVRQTTFYELRSKGNITSSEVQAALFSPFMYSGLQPFPGVLREWERINAPQWVTRDGRRLLSLKLMSPYQQEYEILLDPAEAWQPAEYTTVGLVEPSRTEATSRRGESRYRYAKFHKEGEIRIPTWMHHTSDLIEPNGQRFRSWETVLDITSIRINPDLSQEKFTIDFPSGTKVHDRDRQVMYIVGRPGSEKRVSESVPTEPAAIALNPVAGPWWSDYRVWIALSAIFVSSALWWRWREHKLS